MVLALCETLNNVQKDVNLLELFRVIQERISKMSNLIGDYQMPQCYLFPHMETVFCKRYTFVTYKSFQKKYAHLQGAVSEQF